MNKKIIAAITAVSVMTYIIQPYSPIKVQAADSVVNVYKGDINASEIIGNSKYTDVTKTNWA
ncbi:MAG: hypothetical protein K0R15_1953 [Clostridiales bacterium]|nr:hypothetical protein [Clostridiales bacterium]